MSTREEYLAAAMAAPHGGSVASGDTRPPQRLTGAGTTEASNSTALIIGRMATLLVGAVAIRFRMGSAAGGGSNVATTDPILPAYGRFDWLVQEETQFVYQEAADGAATHESHVFTSSV